MNRLNFLPKRLINQENFSFVSIDAKIARLLFPDIFSMIPVSISFLRLKTIVVKNYKHDDPLFLFTFEGGSVNSMRISRQNLQKNPMK